MYKSKTTLLFIILSLSIVSLVIVGCSDDDSNVVDSSNNITSFIVSVSPAAGSTSVSPSSTMSIKFSQSMDTSLVMDNFDFSGGADMHEWMDSSNFYGGMGQMNMGMNSHMMNWMDSIHIHGTFNWNNNFDSCEFVPDSSMESSTDYMMFMYEGGMTNQSGGMMNMNHGDDGYHMYQFMTE